jgi:TonB-dependent receptor
MNIKYRVLRVVLFASTALTLGAELARAQTTDGKALSLDIGTVVANGTQNGTGNVAPSATGSLKQAQQLKKIAPNVISVQPQSQIQKLPDVNVAEALQRIPGISMESDTGAGRFINIRGLDADLNGTTYDGVHLTAANQATPTGGARAVSFDAFPAGMIGGVEVTKSLTPDMDAEGIGGSVNLLPLSLPAGGGPLVDFSAATGQETLRRTGIYQGEITLGNSFAIPGMRSFANSKPFSVILNYTLHSDRRGIDDVEEDYIGSNASGPGPQPVSDLQFRHYDGHRVTQGFGGEFDFDPDSTTHLYLRALEGGYDERLDKNRLEIDGLDGGNGALTDNGGGSYTATNATAKKVYTNSNERINYQLAAIGGSTIVDDVSTAAE